MAYRLQLPGTFTDTSLPYFAVDPILAPGSVWLIDPGHPVDPWDAGVPSNDTAVPNLIEQHPTFLPEGLDAMPIKFYTDGALTSTLGKVERTTKGGLHIIVSRSEAGDLFTHATDKYYATLRHVVTGPTEWGTYLYGSDGSDGAYHHQWYMSTWTDVTRSQGTSGTNAAISTLLGRNSTNYLNIAHRMKTDVSHYQTPEVKDVSTGVQFNAASSSAPLVAGDPTSGTDFQIYPFIGGHATAYNRAAGSREYAPSLVLYRSYLEDLTVSGRTFDEVYAIDYALFTRDCLTEGGRYYGDEYTDPATIT